MKNARYDKTKKRPVAIKVFGITAVSLLMLFSVAATVGIVAAAGNEKVVQQTDRVTLHLVNNVGSDIIVAWTKAGTTTSVFKVSVPDEQTRTVTVPVGKFEQYVKVKQGSKYSSYQVITNPKYTQLKSGAEYTSTYKWASGGNLNQIPDSLAAKIFK